MNPTPFLEFLEQNPCILSEGAVIERLRRDSDLDLDPFIVNSGFIYQQPLRAAIETIYRQYLDIGLQHQLPLLLSTPTWRASRERIEAAGYADRDVNGDNFRFLDELRTTYGAYGAKVIICGLLSCRGDAYNPSKALNVTQAFEFHTWQATMLAQAGVDFLMAATLPALGEATGLAQALAATGKPYVVSFVLRPEELDNRDDLLTEDPETFGRSVAGLHTELGMQILGGCCGTDQRHIGHLAQQLTR